MMTILQEGMFEKPKLMKLHLKTYFCLYAFICQQIRKINGFQDHGCCVWNLCIVFSLFGMLTL